MAGRGIPGGSGRRSAAAWVRPDITLAVVALVAAAPTLLTSALVLRRHGERVARWDIAGASVLIGCVAAVLSEPANVLQMFGTP